jgi:hypothetical protein
MTNEFNFGPHRVSKFANCVRTVLETIKPGLGTVALGPRYYEVRGRETTENTQKTERRLVTAHAKPAGQDGLVIIKAEQVMERGIDMPEEF